MEKVIFKTQRHLSGNSVEKSDKIAVGLTWMEQKQQSSHDYEKEMFKEFEQNFVKAKAIQGLIDAESIEFAKLEYNYMQQTFENEVLYGTRDTKNFEYTFKFNLTSKVYNLISISEGEVYHISDPSTKEIIEIKLSGSTKAFII